MKSTINFKYLEQKHYRHSPFLSGNTDSDNVVRKMSKESRFRRPIDKQHGKRAQAQLKPPSQHLYHIYWSLATKLCSKKSLLLAWKILGLLVNTLAADEKYPVLHRDNLTIPIQMQISQKQKTFAEFFASNFKSRLNFKHFFKKDDPHRFCIFEVTDC